MAELVLAHILDDYEVGKRFTMWPLHVTVLPPFEVGEVDEVTEWLEQIISSVPLIQAQLGGYAGYGQNRRVRLLVSNPELKSLHTKLLQAAAEHRAEVKSHYIGRHFSPHVTLVAGRDYSGDSFEINKLALVESQPQGYRQVVANYFLKDQAKLHDGVSAGAAK